MDDFETDGPMLNEIVVALGLIVVIVVAAWSVAC